MNRKAFTLIELLAVILILAVISLIAIPIVSKIMTDIKVDALKDSTYGIVSAATMYYATASESSTSKVFTLVDGVFMDGEEKLNHKGSIKGTGNLIIDPQGDITVCINSNGIYSYKSYNTDVVSSGLGDTCKIENNFFVNKYITYLASEGSVVDDYYTKAETDNLMNGYLNLSNLNSVSASTYEMFENAAFTITGAGGTKLLANGASKFGTITSGVLTFDQSGLYYVSSDVVLISVPSTQVYNSITVNSVVLTQSLAQSTTASIPATAFFYAKEGDTLKPALVGHTGTSSIYRWYVRIYKMM